MPKIVKQMIELQVRQKAKSTPVKHQVAKQFRLPNIQVYEGVSRCLTTERNICAHDGRLWVDFGISD